MLAELDWVQASVHGGQRMPRAEMTKRVEEALLQPGRALSQPPDGADPSTAGPRTHSTSSASSSCARERGVALEVNGLSPPGSTSARSTCARRIDAGVRIVCSTDAHSTGGLANMILSVMTARRGWASAADVLNAQPLDALLSR